MSILQQPLTPLHRFVSLLRTELGITIGLAIVVGVVAGLGAVAFRKMIWGFQWLFFDGGARVFGFMGDYYVIIIPAIGGIFVGLLVYFFAREAKGHGVPEVMAAVAVKGGRIRARVSVVKALASSICIGSGGIFAPSLFMGSMLGGALGSVFHRLFPAITAPYGAYALVGMAAVFAGAARAPITAIIILFEMTRNYMIILPLMLAVGISTLISRALSRESIYTMKLRRMGLDISRREGIALLRRITVGEAMSRDFPTVSPQMSMEELAHKLNETGHHGFPVVDEEGHLCGVVTLTDIQAAMSRAESVQLTVDDIATKNVIVAYPDQSVRDALAQFGGRDVGRIPVVDRNDPTKLLGVLRRHDIVRAYAKAVAVGESERTSRGI